MNNEELVRTACRVVWSEGDLERIPEFYAEGFSADYPVTQWGEGLDGIRQLAQTIRDAFPDYHEHIDELIVADNLVVVRLTITATHTGTSPGFPATGKAVEFKDVSICEIKDGKIAAQRGLTDYLSLYVQLGLIELPAAQ